MNLVFYSPNFFPLTGGLEHTVLDLAIGLTQAGHQITVVTSTNHDKPDAFPFAVLRKSGFWQQVSAMRRANIVVQFNVSLKGILPWLFSGRPLAVSHQTANTSDWRGRLKTWVANHVAAVNIGCSNYMSGQFTRAVTIPNPFGSDIFRITTPWEQRKSDIVFVGRLVSDKGADLLLYALDLLRQKECCPQLTIVGSGPEEPVLRQLAGQLGLDKQLVFTGLIKGEALAHTINQHRIMVVPSVWQEPFGIVALEGLACGCVVIGSDGGGLPEAIGGLGLTFPNGDAGALARRLGTILDNPDRYRPQPESLAAHLNRHSRTAVAQAYADLLATIQ